MLGNPVFPAHAGMFLILTCGNAGKPRFPRARGDVPNSATGLVELGEFSPRARGCSKTAETHSASTKVFPACAGMFPSKTPSWPPHPCFPRVRGDVPTHRNPRGTPHLFSPRARGCSLPRPGQQSNLGVFPACAGMFLVPDRCAASRAGFPRVRGDVPRRRNSGNFPW